MEGASEFGEQQAKRFGKALIDLHGGGNAGEEGVLHGELAVAVAKKSDAGAGREDGGEKSYPRKDAQPLNLAPDGGEKNDFQGE